MVLVALTIAAVSLGVALGAVAWARRASRSAPFRAHLAVRDRQLDETQHLLDQARREADMLRDRLLDRESVIAQLTGQLELERRRIDRLEPEQLNLADDETAAIDLRQTSVDDR